MEITAFKLSSPYDTAVPDLNSQYSLPNARVPPLRLFISHFKNPNPALSSFQERNQFGNEAPQTAGFWIPWGEGSHR